MTEIHRSLDQQIRFAIEHKRLVEVTYNGKGRLAEPHDYGVQNGIERLLVYQRGSSPVGRRETHWRLLSIPEIERLVVSVDTFPGSRGRDHSDHKTWDVVYARVA